MPLSFWKFLQNSVKKGKNKRFFLPRSAGILLHPTSLFTPYGIGDLGPSAYQFIDFLEDSGQIFWQVLPLGPTGYGDSPYQTISAFAGNHLLISPEKLIQMKLISKTFLESTFNVNSENKTPSTSNILKVNYKKVRDKKTKMLKVAFDNFKKSNNTGGKYSLQKFQQFCMKQKYWLENFVLYFALRQEFNLQSWVSWPENFRKRDFETLDKFREKRKDDLEQYRFFQWLFTIQWDELKEYAHKHSIQIIGDMPIFVAHDSVDVWVYPEYFTLYTDGSLKYQAGVPPDYFSKTGQLWGNPLYNWNVMKSEKYSWFIRRFKRLLELVDWIRVDHFRGFESYWKVLGNENTAINGEWVKTPGKKLFLKIQKQLGKLPLIAEDLGVITPEVEQLRDFFQFPGMRILQFAFGDDETNPHLPHNYEKNSVAYTGTHDNDTLLGWWDSVSESEKKYLKTYFNTDANDVTVDLVKALYRSVANLVIVPIQDFLKQGTKARMNTPSVPKGNWQYQLDKDLLTPNVSGWIKELVEIYRRSPFSSSSSSHPSSLKK
ncbi:MAG: 4-alpha-glucanotransferase [Promethearchaeota archaeon]